MKHAFVALALILSAICFSAAWAEEKKGAASYVDNPDAMLRMIDTLGVEGAVSKLATDGKWEKVYAHIDGGDDRWLKVADGISCCVDAGLAEALPISVSVALTHNPEGVLRITGDHEAFDLQDICSVPLH